MTKRLKKLGESRQDVVCDELSAIFDDAVDGFAAQCSGHSPIENWDKGYSGLHVHFSLGPLTLDPHNIEAGEYCARFENWGKALGVSDDRIAFRPELCFGAKRSPRRRHQGI